LIEKTARSKNELTKIKLGNQFPIYQNEPLQVEVISITDDLITLKNNQQNSPLIEHVTIDNLWLGKTWAGKPGWNIMTADSSKLHYFVSEPSTWNTLRITNQLKQNERVSVNKSLSSQPDSFYLRKLVSTMIFYILFLVAAGFLWLAPKI